MEQILNVGGFFLGLVEVLVKKWLRIGRTILVEQKLSIGGLLIEY